MPTLTWTGAVDPEVGFTRAVPEKAGEPVAVAKLSEPVLKMASSADELSAGTDVGAVTPGNPVTPAQVPTGSATAAPVARGAELVGDVVTSGVAPVPLAPFAAEPVKLEAEAELADAAAGLEAGGLVVDPAVPVAPDVEDGAVGVEADELLADELLADEVAGAETTYAAAVAASVSHAGAAKWYFGEGLPDVVDGVEDVVVGTLAEEDELDGDGPAEDGVADVVAAGSALTNWVCGAVGVAVEPDRAAGAARPPAVARLATIPSTTEPLPGAAVAEATAAWPSGVAETWVRSWSPACTGVPAIAEAADVPVAGVLAASACAPASRAAGWPTPASTRRNAARTPAASTSGAAAHAPFTASSDSRALCSAARARRTRVLAFVSVMPSAPATSS